jgi:hypothetical protein
LTFQFQQNGTKLEGTPFIGWGRAKIHRGLSTAVLREKRSPLPCTGEAGPMENIPVA